MDIKRINKVKEETRRSIERKSALTLPDEPTARGFRADQIKRRLALPVTDKENSALAEIDRVAVEANEAIDNIEEAIEGAVVKLTNDFPHATWAIPIVAVIPPAIGSVTYVGNPDPAVRINDLVIVPVRGGETNNNYLGVYVVMAFNGDDAIRIKCISVIEVPAIVDDLSADSLRAVSQRAVREALSTLTERVEDAEMDIEDLENNTVDKDDFLGLRAELFEEGSGAISTLNQEVLRLDSTKADIDYVDNEFARLVDTAPEAFDTLKEIADYIATHGEDAANLTARVADAENNIEDLQNNIEDLQNNTVDKEDFLGLREELHDITKADIGLGNVDNTSDADKPISNAVAAELSTKAPTDSPALTGTPTTSTPSGTNPNQIANVEYVASRQGTVVSVGGVPQGSIGFTSDPQTQLNEMVLKGNSVYNAETNTYEVTLENPPTWFDLDKGVPLRIFVSDDLKAGAKIKLMNPEYYTNPNEETGVWRNYYGIGLRRDRSMFGGLSSYDTLFKRYVGNGFLEMNNGPTPSSGAYTAERMNVLADRIANYETQTYTMFVETKDKKNTSGLRFWYTDSSLSPFGGITGVSSVGTNGISKRLFSPSNSTLQTSGRLIYCFPTNGSTGYEGTKVRVMLTLGDLTDLTTPADYWENDFGTWEIKPTGGGAFMGGEWKQGDVVEVVLGVEGAFFNKQATTDSPAQGSTALVTAGGLYNLMDKQFKVLASGNYTITEPGVYAVAISPDSSTTFGIGFTIDGSPVYTNVRSAILFVSATATGVKLGGVYVDTNANVCPLYHGRVSATGFPNGLINIYNSEGNARTMQIGKI